MTRLHLDRITTDLMNKFLKSYEIESEDITKDFEKFTVYCAIKHNYLPYLQAEEIDSLVVAGTNDTGIDGVGIIVDNKIVENEEDLETILHDKDSVPIKFIFIQSTVTKEFKRNKFSDFTLAIREFLYDYARPDSIKTKSRSKKIEEKASLANQLLNKIVSMPDRPICKIYYITGNEQENRLKVNTNLVKKEKQEIEELSLFSDVEIKIKGTQYLHTLYRESLTKPKVKINFPDRVPLPEIDDIAESYIGIIKFQEFKKLIIADNSDSIMNVFEDNVRDFNETYTVNKEIQKTIDDGNSPQFILLNNGVTIVTKKLHVSAHYLTLEDYQIINGCQTSNILYKCRNHPDVDKVCLTLKIINTTNQEITNKITSATNSQTQVSYEALHSLLEFHKQLERYYEASDYYNGSKGSKFKLFYGRQEGKYDKDQDIIKTRIVSIKEQAKSFAAMFLDVPEESQAFYGQRLKKKRMSSQKSQEPEIFNNKHYPDPYYTSAALHYELHKYLKNKSKNGTSFVRYRFHLLMIFKYMVLGDNIPNLTSNKIKSSCNKLVDHIKKKDFSNLLDQSIEILKESMQESDVDDKEKLSKRQDFTKIIRSKAIEFYKKKTTQS